METYSVDKYRGHLIGVDLECTEDGYIYSATILHNGEYAHGGTGHNPDELLDIMKRWVDSKLG